MIPAALSLIFCASFVPAKEIARDAARHAGLPNFHRVNEVLYRGGQPKQGGLRELARLGVKTVVNLRDDDERARAEGEEARAEGLLYFNVPLGRLGRPPEAEVERVLRLIDAPENQPVFVHCRRGADRTGVVVAVYRMTHEGWTAGRAQEEANLYGMGAWQLGKKDFIRDYYRDRLQGGAAVKAGMRR
jgi:protein tyrosine/serine phosphatase